MKLKYIFISLIFIINIISPCFNIKVSAYDADDKIIFENHELYSEYYSRYSEYEKPESRTVINACDYYSISDGNFKKDSFEGRDNVLIWNSISGSVSYRADISESGIYSVCLSYCAMESSLSECEISVMIDGKIPYDAASSVILSKTWEKSEPDSYDIYGNQVHPSLNQKIMWKNTYLMNTDGIFCDPLIFYLGKGSHTITISSEKAYFALEKIIIQNPENYPDYSQYSEYADITSVSGVLERTEGENAAYTSDSVLCASYDRNDYMCSPSDAVKTVFNTLGRDVWNKSMQSVTWETDIKKDGWYKIGIRYRQNEMRGICSHRRIYIDGEVPFSEFDCVSFPYTSEWNLLVPSDNDNSELYIHLTAGKHTLTLEAVSGETGEAIRSVDSIVNQLNEYYQKIIMITGTNPDKYTDYYVHEKIPELSDKFSEFSAELRQIQSDVEKLSGVKGSEASQLEKMYVILDKCIEKPLKIPEYVSQIKDNISALSSWSRTFRQQPLEIDYIEIASSDMDFSQYKGNFFKSLIFRIKAFIGSFFTDYSILSDNKGDDVLDIWVCSGRDQTQIIKELADSDFTEKYGITVNVNLVQGTILEACMSGDTPDAALFLGGEFPVTLAVRDLAVCLSDFDDYEEISERFHENADIQYTYQGGVYALPLSQSWAMMFYRKDILSGLGFDYPPQTWQELIDMLPELQRNHMSAGLVLPSSDISPATETGHTYAALLMQNGLSYYNEDMTASDFNSTKAMQLFEYWTDMYTEYGLEQSYDAFSRFRTGEYPIVIQDYSFSGQLEYNAPEINGLWDFTYIPGTEISGTVSHAENSSGSGAVIFSDSDKKDNAWLFLKWFTSDEIQSDYAQRTESISGRLGRFTPANTKALENMPVSGHELEKLMKQREQLSEIPVIPASYAVTRNIMNAFRDTVNNKNNPYSTLMQYTNEINDEISRKNHNISKAVKP